MQGGAEGRVGGGGEAEEQLVAAGVKEAVDAREGGEVGVGGNDPAVGKGAVVGGAEEEDEGGVRAVDGDCHAFLAIAAAECGFGVAGNVDLPRCAAEKGGAVLRESDCSARRDASARKLVLKTQKWHSYHLHSMANKNHICRSRVEIKQISGFGRYFRCSR